MYDYKRVVEITERNLEQRDREIIESYVKGVNDAVRDMKVLPLEFWILWIGFEEWTIKDVLTLEVLIY